jgi:hypothetical protein
MSKILKRIVRLLDQGLAFILIGLALFILVISRLLIIILSPLIAFVGANGYKMAQTTTVSWWQIYKDRLIDTCTDMLPIVVYMNNF